MSDPDPASASSPEEKRFRVVMELFDRCLDRPEEDRAAFLEGELSSVGEIENADDSLAAEVLALLRGHQDEQPLPTIPTLMTKGGSSGVTAPRAEAGPLRVGRFRIVEKIAEGGMGAVYLAEQETPVRRLVALKLLKPEMESADVLSRFEAERQALALMDHPYIAKVLDGGVAEDGRPFFAMEYVKGEPVTLYCEQRKLSLEARLLLFIKICGAVQHAHQKGIIHRDIKPSNVLVMTADESSTGDEAMPRVIDFGIAKAVGPRLTEETLFTAHGLLVGTPEYMSPEQASGLGLDIDTRSDVYSLGILLYEMLVADLPFERTRLREVEISEALRVLREEEPPRPSTRLTSLPADRRQEIAQNRRTSESQLRRELSRDLDWIVLRALEKDRNRRYASASELAADLERYLRNEPVAAGPPSLSYRARKFGRRHRLGVAAATTLALVLATSAITLNRQAQLLKVALEDAQEQALRAETISGLLVDAFQDADPTGRDVDREVTAKDVLERGAASLEDSSPSEEVRSALSVSMADAFLGLNDVERADQLADKALEAAEKVEGESLVDALLVKARVLRTRSSFSEATALAERAVEHSELFDLGPRVRIEALQSLGRSLQNLGRYADADGRLREAQALATASGALDDRALARLLLTHAQNFHFTADYEEALALEMKALGLLESASSNPLHSVDARRVIASTLSEIGRVEEALGWDEGSYQIANARLGEEHLSTRTLRNNYALRLNNLGRNAEALELFQKSVAVSRRLDPEDDMITYELNNLGLVQQGLGDLELAEATFREALAKQYAHVGYDHPNPGFHLMNLARVLQETGRYREAESNYEEALELWQRLLPEGHTLIGSVSIWYGALLLETGRAEQALPMLERGVEIRTRDRGQEDWQTAEALSWLGAALATLDKGGIELARAEELLTQSYAVILDQRGAHWRRTRWALRRLLGFYDLVGDTAKFDDYAEKYQVAYGPLQAIVPARRWSAQ